MWPLLCFLEAFPWRDRLSAFSFFSTCIFHFLWKRAVSPSEGKGQSKVKYLLSIKRMCSWGALKSPTYGKSTGPPSAQLFPSTATWTQHGWWGWGHHPSPGHQKWQRSWDRGSLFPSNLRFPPWLVRLILIETLLILLSKEFRILSPQTILNSCRWAKRNQPVATIHIWL